MADTSQYTSLIAREHADKPKFIATLEALLQPLVDIRSAIEELSNDFNVDTAVGKQLDIVGQWVGQSRFVNTNLEGVFFSFDTENVGFDQGVWFGPFDSFTGISVLPDDQYRLLIFAHIAIDAWDGTIPGAVESFNLAFQDRGYRLSIKDYQDMTMDMIMNFGTTLDQVFRLLLVSGYLDFRPAGVRIRNYVIVETAAPLFGFGLNNSTVAGFGVGVWKPVSH